MGDAHLLVVLQFMSGLARSSGGGGVAFWAHTGGFVAGIIGVKLFARPDHIAMHRKQHWRPQRVRMAVRQTAQTLGSFLSWVALIVPGWVASAFGIRACAADRAFDCSSQMKTAFRPWIQADRLAV